MNKIFGILAIFAFVASAVASDNETTMLYMVEIELDPVKNEVGDQIGAVNAFFHTTYSIDRVRLMNITVLREGFNYRDYFYYHELIQNIDNVFIQWEADKSSPFFKSPENWNKRPYIHLKKVSIYPRYVRGHFAREKLAKHFCVQQSDEYILRHEEILLLEKC